MPVNEKARAQRTMTTATASLDSLLDLFADRVAAKLVERMTAPTSHYGAAKAATLPPGKSRAWALRTLKTIPGAHKVGRDWVVSVEDFDAWASEQDTMRTARVGTAVPPRAAMSVSSSMTLAERADRSLAANDQMRRTK